MDSNNFRQHLAQASETPFDYDSIKEASLRVREYGGESPEEPRESKSHSSQEVANG